MENQNAKFSIAFGWKQNESHAVGRHFTVLY